jgi:hypothetical protein
VIPDGTLDVQRNVQHQVTRENVFDLSFLPSFTRLDDNFERFLIVSGAQVEAPTSADSISVDGEP